MADWWESAPVVHPSESASSGNWWESAPLAEEEKAPDFSDVAGGSSSTSYLPKITPLEIAMAPYRGGRLSQGPEEEAATRQAGEEGLAASGKTAATLASMGAGSAMSAKLLPFLARLGAGASAARAGAGAAVGAAGAAPAAIPQLVRGDVGGAAGSVASGAALGAGIGLVPGAGPLIAKLAKAGIAPAQAARIAESLAAEAVPAAEAAAPAVAEAAAAPTVAANTRQLLQLAKESGAKVGQKVWFLLENGQPTKFLTPDQAGAAARAGQATTWVKVL